MTEQKDRKKTKPRSGDYIGFRAPAGWKQQICQRAGTENVSEAVVAAVAEKYDLKYRQGEAGRPPKIFDVDVTTPHSESLVRAVFAAFAQPWPVKVKTIVPGVPMPATFVACTCGSETCNSQQVGSKKGVELAREIAAEIDKAAGELE